MKYKRLASSVARIEKQRSFHFLSARRYLLHARAFTLVETLVAISLLTIAIVAPMALTTQSLSSAHYAKDQMTASHLAQEAIETIRHVRDGNILKISQSGGASVNLLQDIPKTDGSPFAVNTLDDTMMACTLNNKCPPLQMNKSNHLYGYHSGCNIPTTNDCGAVGDWANSIFTRTVTARFIPNGSYAENEVRIEVTVEWKTAGGLTRDVVISENLYRWVKDSAI